MGIPDTITNYLHGREIAFDVVSHQPTMTSLETAQLAHIPGDRVAKAVVLEDGEEYVLAVVPATHRIDTEALSDLLDRDVFLVDEDDVAMVFRDCRYGAVPPVGGAYGLLTVIDEAIARQPDVYLESGDHEHLIHVDHKGFLKLMAGAERGSFSQHV
jgi:Ala-tRNA(Pro) deacylase